MLLTVAEVKDRLRFNHVEAVLKLIHQGSLRAINVSHGVIRPTWRIREDDLEAYLSSRTHVVAAPSPRRRRKATAKAKWSNETPSAVPTPANPRPTAPTGANEMTTETDLLVEPSRENDGMWYWAFIVDGGVFADGEQPTEKLAREYASHARWDWEDRNR